jgi:hypothetical protein
MMGATDAPMNPPAEGPASIATGYVLSQPEADGHSARFSGTIK